MRSGFAPVESAIETIARGGVVIVIDAWDRENEGDFLAAAELITPETIHFMTTYGRGHLCLSVLPSTARQIDVRPLVSSDDMVAPRFAMPVDSLACTTGISPMDRVTTIRAIIDRSSRPRDFVRPGHIFPLIAQDGGVLDRPGHTEFAVDATQLAGLSPAGVLCEICSRDGRHMADVAELALISEEHDLPIVTIDELIAYRRQNADAKRILERDQDSADNFSATGSA